MMVLVSSLCHLGAIAVLLAQEHELLSLTKFSPSGEACLFKLEMLNWYSDHGMIPGFLRWFSACRRVFPHVFCKEVLLQGKRIRSQPEKHFCILKCLRWGWWKDLQCASVFTLFSPYGSLDPEVSFLKMKINKHNLLYFYSFLWINFYGFGLWILFIVLFNQS